jgi:thiamine biosynthesis protein ThiS
VKIRLNGEPKELPAPLTVTQLLEQLAVDPRRVAVEHNLTIIKRDRQGATMINEGDEVEIVNFVGGGQGKPVNWRTGELADEPADREGNDNWNRDNY